jgi:hypothetical protein
MPNVVNPCPVTVPQAVGCQPGERRVILIWAADAIPCSCPAAGGLELAEPAVQSFDGGRGRFGPLSVSDVAGENLIEVERLSRAAHRR